MAQGVVPVWVGTIYNHIVPVRVFLYAIGHGDNVITLVAIILEGITSWCVLDSFVVPVIASHVL